uniref:3 transmembrane helices protein n=1 Tax=Pithovirus LCPAC201 TaxID=2506591 RepID=A0A481Z5A9_9VIRU|nr:MAG: 3 transmembrane helices protein [Pithovirus LCPAC201]
MDGHNFSPNYKLSSSHGSNREYQWVEKNPEILPWTYAPCKSSEIDISGQLIPSWLVLILVVIGIIIILIVEYRDHDCASNKKCKHSVPKPGFKDDDVEYIDKLINMVHNNYDYILWRQALLVGLIVPFIVIFYLKARLPTFIEFFIIGIIVFFIVYLTFSWVWSHFFFPNGQAIEGNLDDLKKRLVSKKRNYFL